MIDSDSDNNFIVLAWQSCADANGYQSTIAEPPTERTKR